MHAPSYYPTAIRSAVSLCVFTDTFRRTEAKHGNQSHLTIPTSEPPADSNNVLLITFDLATILTTHSGHPASVLVDLESTRFFTLLASLMTRPLESDVDKELQAQRIRSKALAFCEMLSSKAPSATLATWAKETLAKCTSVRTHDGDRDLLTRLGEISYATLSLLSLHSLLIPRVCISVSHFLSSPWHSPCNHIPVSSHCSPAC